MRSHKDRKVVTAVSKDHGKTWAGIGLTDVTAPNSGLCAITLVDGRVVLAHNTQSGRRSLVLSMSYDHGESYEQVAVLEDERNLFKREDECFAAEHPETEDGPEYSYPSIIQAAHDGMLHVTYTYTYYGSGGRCSGRENIKHLVVDPCKLGDVKRAPFPCHRPSPSRTSFAPSHTEDSSSGSEPLAPRAAFQIKELKKPIVRSFSWSSLWGAVDAGDNGI